MRTLVTFQLAVMVSAGCGGSAEYVCPTIRHRETAMSGPIPDLTDITHDRGVAQAVSGATEHPFEVEQLCIIRSDALPGLIGISARDPDYGCLALGFIYQREYVADVRRASVVLGPLGWSAASPERRVELARAWVEQVMMREATFLDTAPEPGDFGGSYPPFSAPQAAPTPDGGVQVEGWVRDRRGEGRRYQLRRYVFDSEGDVTGSSGVRCFQAGG